MKQDQFLDVASLDDARTRWRAALDLSVRATEHVALAEAHGRILAADVIAPGDVPAFDRSNVDGFAVHAVDTFGASERAPAALRLDGPAIDAGMDPAGTLEPGTARVLATGGVLPRGADAVVMVEDTDANATHVRIMKPVAPGGRISHAGSDVARGEIVLRAGTRLTARETGTLAACGIAQVPCVRRPRVAVLSTGNEIVAPGTPLAPGLVHDANATLLADTLRELGAEPHMLGIARDDVAELESALDEARAFDATILSGGTSKGGGDLSYRVLETRAQIIVHGVALKPGKPLCLAAWNRKPVVVLPGFPTSAIFTFHAVVAPVLREMLGQRERAGAQIQAQLPRHVASEQGRREFNLVNLVRGRSGWLAFPLGKGSGSITTFARADGFFDIPADVEYVEAGHVVEVTLLGRDVRPADLVVIGSHCPGVDRILSHLARAGLDAKVLAVGSRGGIDAAAEDACDVAPIHLFDPASDTWNAPFAPEGVRVLSGYMREQGLAFRAADRALYAQAPVDDALRAALGDHTRRVANRNRASGTFLALERFVAPGPLPPGWTTAYRSHTAVASAIAQGRADYGICIAQAASAAGLAWLPWREERLDFLVPAERWDSPAVAAFRAALAEPSVRAALAAIGMAP
ncbi:MAG: molybdopterin biosynthesis protein [Planctomycetota bacterium]|nr:molybdopterin biosynthesis protein [Planctomycetota bacterium]